MQLLRSDASTAGRTDEVGSFHGSGPYASLNPILTVLLGVSMSENTLSSYTQPTKIRARRLALTHAIELVTSRRDAATIVEANHPQRVRDALLKSDFHGYPAAGAACDPKDLESWRTLRAAAIGTRTPADITVAYLAGPEPENDLDVLLELGVRPENIWAFEVDKKVAAKGLNSLRRLKLRGVKFIPVSIEDYFINTPRRFDIIYFDACGPLPSKDSNTARVLMTMFRHCALAPLGVLVSNFARPDISEQVDLDRYAFLVGAYLYPKGFLESPLGDGANAHGFAFNEAPESPEESELENETEDEEYEVDPSPDFWDEVKADFERYYGMFITRALMDMATIVAPTARLVGGDLYKVLFRPDIKAAIDRGTRYVCFNQCPAKECGSGADETGETAGDLFLDEAFIDLDGDAIAEADQYSLLWTLAACGAFPAATGFGPVPEGSKKLLSDWCNAMAGKSPGKRFHELVAIYYAWRHDRTLWSDALRRIADFPYHKSMPFLCDVPTEEIGFYPAFAQLAYPAHPNVRETKRFRYLAEGKQTPMFMDVIAFDECRYIYDWLSAMHLTPEDWTDISAQLTFRFALDGIAKDKRYVGEDFLYGCHVIDESRAFPAGHLAPREDLSTDRTDDIDA
jgi:hypothetical protein